MLLSELFCSASAHFSASFQQLALFCYHTCLKITLSVWILSLVKLGHYGELRVPAVPFGELHNCIGQCSLGSGESPVVRWLLQCFRQ